jgi:hypothetical protein
MACRGADVQDPAREKWPVRASWGAVPTYLIQPMPAVQLKHLRGAMGALGLSRCKVAHLWGGRPSAQQLQAAASTVCKSPLKPTQLQERE